MSARSPWTVVDVLLVALTGLVLVGLWGVFLFFAPSFASMYEELEAQLSGLTRLVLSSTGQIGIPAACSVLAGLGLSRRQAPAKNPRRGLLMVALFVDVGVLFATVYALYAPLFAVSGAIE